MGAVGYFKAYTVGAVGYFKAYTVYSYPFIAVGAVGYFKAYTVYSYPFIAVGAVGYFKAYTVYSYPFMMERSSTVTDEIWDSIFRKDPHLVYQSFSDKEDDDRPCQDTQQQFINNLKQLNVSGGHSEQKDQTYVCAEQSRGYYQKIQKLHTKERYVRLQRSIT